MWSLVQKTLLVLMFVVLFFLPMVVFADAGETNQADANARAAMMAEIKAELKKELREELKEEIKEELRNELRSQLRAELVREITGEIIAQLTEAGIDLAYVEPGFDLEAEKKLKITKLPQTEAEYEEALVKVREKIRQAKNVPPKLPPSKQNFIIKDIQVNGNDLILTSELFEELPLTYTVSGQNGEEENYNFETLSEVISGPGTERTVSLQAIQGLTKYILSVYQNRGYAGIYVYVPMKSVGGVGRVENGVLQIQILETRVGEITVTSYDFDRQVRTKEILKSSLVEKWSPAKVGEVVDEKKLDDFVRLMSLNPDRYVSAVVSRGDDPNVLNLGYNVYEGNPWHWYFQIDNSGTSKRKWSPRIGMINTNLTGMDDKLSVMYQVKPLSTEHMKNNYWLYGTYDFPFLTPRLRLGVYGGYTKFDVTPDREAGINFRGDGSFYGATARFTVLQRKDWFFDILGSYGTENSKVTPSLGIDVDIEMDLLGLGFEIHRTGEMSSTSIGFNRTQCMDASSKEDFKIARWQSNPDFTIYTLSFFHKRFLDASKIHELSVSYKNVIPTERLVPAKMTTFGGMYSIRGYEENAIVADGGFISSLQYRWDVTRYFEKKNGFGEEGEEEKSSYEKDDENEWWPPRISLLGYTDYGRSVMKDSVPGEAQNETLWSIGTGTLLDVGNNMDIGVYYSWPLVTTEDTEKHDGRWNFNLIYRW